MDKHYGQIVELVIRKGGYSISEIARLTVINRKTVYNWFNQKYLKPEIIYKIGCVINHDFSVEFPELFTKDHFSKQNKEVFMNTQGGSNNEMPENIAWKDRYIALLEKYNNLLVKRLGNEITL
ncbi:MAG: helix-turn-helix domain-containing protein [Mucilaginibacter sp.]|nr:helix-turn-helix domain-containing protein [Mucilaginibacter sp.]